MLRWSGQVLPLELPVVGVLLSWVASLVAAWGIHAVGAHLHDRRTGVLLAVLWGLLPHAVVQSMAYTESIFTAFAAWCLLATLRRRWVAAGMLALSAGLTRPTAVAVIAVVLLAALLAVVRRRDGWRPWAALALAPAGWVGYVGWVGVRAGRPDGWFHIQGVGWQSRWDGGGYTVRTAAERLIVPQTPFDIYLVTAVLLLAGALFALCLLDRQAWQLLLFSGLMLAVTLGSAGYYHAKARFLLPAFRCCCRWRGHSPGCGRPGWRSCSGRWRWSPRTAAATCWWSGRVHRERERGEGTRPDCGEPEITYPRPLSHPYGWENAWPEAPESTEACRLANSRTSARGTPTLAERNGVAAGRVLDDHEPGDGQGRGTPMVG